MLFKSLVKKNQYSEGTSKGHEYYSFLKVLNSIPVSSQMTRTLYILLYNIFTFYHLARGITFTFYRKVSQNYDLTSCQKPFKG